MARDFGEPFYLEDLIDEIMNSKYAILSAYLFPLSVFILLAMSYEWLGGYFFIILSIFSIVVIIFLIDYSNWKNHHISNMTWPQFRKMHKGKPSNEVTKLWREYKNSISKLHSLHELKKLEKTLPQQAVVGGYTRCAALRVGTGYRCSNKISIAFNRREGSRLWSGKRVYCHIHKHRESLDYLDNR